jgi:hypothetical protein
MADKINGVEFVGTDNCALCRGQFPRRTTTCGADAWQSEFRAGKLLSSLPSPLPFLIARQFCARIQKMMVMSE